MFIMLSSDPGWIMVKPSFCWWGWVDLALVCPGWFFWLSPTFMTIIWNEGELLKRDLVQPFYGRVECRSPILGLDFASFMRGNFYLYFYEYYTNLYLHHMTMISLLFLLLLCWLCMCFMIVAMHASHNVFIFKWIDNVSMT